jgi:hypothetical protein
MAGPAPRPARFADHVDAVADAQLADRRHPTLREMEDLAWVLRTDSRRRKIGFVQARELKPGLRYVLSDDWD